MSKDTRLDPPSRSRVISTGEARTARAFRISLVALVLIGATIAGIIFVPRLFAPAEQAVHEQVVEAPRQRERPPEVQIPAVGFTDMTEASGIDFIHVNGAYGDKPLPETMGGGVAFLDYDKDGDRDLFVANYVKWSRDIDMEINFQLTGIGRAYGPPTTFAGSYPYLYRNDGDWHFTDVSAGSGVQVDNPATGQPMAKSLGVAPIDIDRDGFMDRFVANDTVQNFFFHNQGDGSFAEEGVIFGVAFDRNGNATGAMGADAARYRNHEDVGLAVGNFANEMTSLYITQGDPSQFADEAIGDGVGPASRKALSFGLFFFDYDLDGREDLFEANGHPEQEIDVVQPSQHHAQHPQLFWNCGPECPTTFLETPPATTGALATPVVGRGASYADIDGDCDLDIVITQVGRGPLLLRNDQQLDHHWLRVLPVGHQANRDAIGAVVERQTNQLFHNLGDGRFKESTDQGGELDS